MYSVYVISSLNKNYIYVGLTNNFNRRFNQHQNGKERTTIPYKPFKVIFCEDYSTRESARIREKYLKSGVGKEWIKNNFITVRI